MPGPWVEKRFSFDDLTEADFSSLVGRLRATPVRIVDMLLFAAEHDAHHLARMEELVRGG